MEVLASDNPYAFKPFRIMVDLPVPAAPTTTNVTSDWWGDWVGIISARHQCEKRDIQEGLEC